MLTYEDRRVMELMKFAKGFGSITPVLKAARDQPTTVKIRIAPQGPMADMVDKIAKTKTAGMYDPAMFFGDDQITLTPGDDNVPVLAHELTHYLDMSDRRTRGVASVLGMMFDKTEAERLADEPAHLIGRPSERLKTVLGKRAPKVWSAYEGGALTSAEREQLGKY